MHKNFDSIDIFFIVIISIYFVALFLFISILLIRFFEKDTDKNELLEKKTKKKKRVKVKKEKTKKIKKKDNNREEKIKNNKNLIKTNEKINNQFTNKGPKKNPTKRSNKTKKSNKNTKQTKKISYSKKNVEKNASIKN